MFFRDPPAPAPFKLADPGSLRPGFYWVLRATPGPDVADVVEVRDYSPMMVDGGRVESRYAWIPQFGGGYRWIPVEELGGMIRAWAGPLPEPHWPHAFMSTEQILEEVESVIDSLGPDDVEAFDDDLVEPPRRGLLSRMAGAIATGVGAALVDWKGGQGWRGDDPR